EQPFLQPPTALPVFWLFAALPFTPSFVIWTVLNTLACLALVAFAQRTLLVQEQLDGTAAAGAASWRLPPWVVVGLTAVVLISDASLLTFFLGQVSILATVLLLAALSAQGRGRTAWAGVWLALATLKVGTLVPFLLLFHRRRDGWAWLTLVAVSLGLCLA